MSEIFMPQNIIFGENSLNKTKCFNCSKALLISDAVEDEMFYSFEKHLNKMIAQVKTVVNLNKEQIYNSAIEIISDYDAEIIISYGTAELIDCAMLLSYQSGIKFAAIPTCSAGCATDFPKIQYRTYRTTPYAVVLEPKLMRNVGSMRMAYDAFSCLAYTFDTMIQASNSIIYDFAFNGAVTILENILPAFHGDMRAIESLMYAMYFSVATHRNINLSFSPLEKLTEFFSQFGYSKQSMSAMCLPNFAKYYCSDFLADLARKIGTARSSEDNESAVKKMIFHLRKIQAAIGIPRAITAYGEKNDMFKAFKENTRLPDELLNICYFGKASG